MQLKNFNKVAQVAGVRANPRSVSIVPRADIATQTALSGMVFMPFEESKAEMATIGEASQDIAKTSLARCGFHESCEAAINEQINIELTVSYIYTALYNYFDRDTIGLPGLAKFFKDQMDEEKEHAEIFMKYQAQRGGRTMLKNIQAPELSEFNHPEKGDALYAMELTLSLEKLVFQKLKLLHDVASNANDAQMCDFIEGEFLKHQVESIREISTYVAQLRRVGKGHGVFHFDTKLGDGLAA